MRRSTLFVIGSIVLTVAIVTLLGLMLTELRKGQPAIVYFNPGVVDGNMRQGEVTKTDKYVTIRSDAHGEEVFTWNQIRYISEKNVPTSKKLDQVVDLIDFLSKLGIAVTIGLFVIGLYQYRQAQKWEREKFLAAAVKEFMEVKSAKNARQMLDSLALYQDGRWIELFPQAETLKERKVFVSNEEIYKALTTTPHKDLERNDDRAVTIRDSFDAFLSYMTTFAHYIEQDLITEDALSAHLGYWIELLGPKGKLSAKYKSRIFRYAREYGLDDIEDLIQRHQKRSVWERTVGRLLRDG